jgi:hypothetical protein
LADITGRAAGNHGFATNVLEAAESRLGVRLPSPLRGYYGSIGRHKINRAFNRLLPPGGLEISQGRLVFMEENQCVVFWGVRCKSAAADPVVFQTTDPEDGDWFAESTSSQFLSAMLCWQAVGGGAPYMGWSNPIDLATVRRLSRKWSLVGRIKELSAFLGDGSVVCVLKEGTSATLHVASSNRRRFQALKSETGLGIHEG